jgi:chromosome segregation ATPase
MTKERVVSDGDDMKKVDLTVEILKDIREENRRTNAELQELRQEFRQELREGLGTLRQELGARIDETNRRLVASEARTATAITELAGDVRELTSYLRAQGDLRPRVERCERDIADLQAKERPAS